MHLLALKTHTQSGFTLIEVITVIVILSILSALGGKFVVESTQAYQATQTRARLMNTGRQAIERMSRQLRIALPNSVRLTNSNTCIEYMPIASGGNYAGYVPDTVNGAAAAASIAVGPHNIDYGSAQYVTIGANTASEIYGASPNSRATLSSRTAILLTLSSARVWQRNSVASRFYLLDNPQAFCVVANQLRYYANQSATSASVDLNSTFNIIADTVATATPFTLTAGSENRNLGVSFAISFTASGETILFNHSVMLRNVP